MQLRWNENAIKNNFLHFTPNSDEAMENGSQRIKAGRSQKME